jgi:hypothetical protein
MEMKLNILCPNYTEQPGPHGRKSMKIGVDQGATERGHGGLGTCGDLSSGAS